MAFCSECGSKLSETFKFCPGCGSQAGTSDITKTDSSESGLDYSDLGEHTVNFRSLLESGLAGISIKAIKGLQKFNPEVLDENVAGLAIQGDRVDVSGFDLDTMLNSGIRDKYQTFPLYVCTPLFHNGILGVFRLANKGKGLTQIQQKSGSYGHTDHLIFLEKSVVLISDIVGTLTWNVAEHYTVFRYDQISQCRVSQDTMTTSGFTTTNDYHHNTYSFSLINGSLINRYLMLGLGERERNNNIHKAAVFGAFVGWKLRHDLNPERFIEVRGSNTDNTIKTSIGFGLFREIGD